MHIVEDSEGISPRTAAALLAVIAVLGVGLYALSVAVDYKSPDPMYDLEKLENHTASQVMETPELFKKKEPPAEEPKVTPSRPPASAPSLEAP